MRLEKHNSCDNKCGGKYFPRHECKTKQINVISALMENTEDEKQGIILEEEGYNVEYQDACGYG